MQQSLTIRNLLKFLLTLAVLTTVGTVAVLETDQMKPATGRALAQPAIEIANQSGVAGYNIGIFGAGFGTTQGTVTILGSSAEILEWTDTFVQVVVPETSPGTGFLVITNAEGLSTSTFFESYSINPAFLNPPDVRFKDIGFKKPVQLHHLTDSWCYQQPEATWTEAVDYLTNYRCGFNGVTGDGHATFDSSLGNGAIIAVDLEEIITDTIYLQFFNSSGWYADQSATPRDYVIEVSTDSTDGEDGTWETVATESGNNRAFRLHTVNMPTNGARWVRLRVTESNMVDHKFIMKELRIYQPDSEAQSKWDMLSIYGDSITKDANEIIGHLGVEQRIKEDTSAAEDLILSVYGLSGQNSTGLEDQVDVNFDIYDAFNLDQTASRSYYWGIALGTNDSNDSIDRQDEVFSNLGGYDERLDAILQTLIDNGSVPIVARIPDTDEAQGGFGTLATKKKILADIDRMTAKYRLIPGPDLYTAYRRNIETSSSSWIREGDGTHHSNEGRTTLLSMWSEAFVNGTNRNASITTVTPTPSPTSTNTPEPTSTPTSTATPLSTATPTSSATATPIATSTASVLTPVPSSTNTGTGTPPNPGKNYLPFISD